MQNDSPAESLVGRTAEIKVFVDALNDLDKGRGQVLLLAGEPGIGKTTLARFIADQGSAQGVSVYWGFTWEAGGAPAYWPWTQLLRTLVNEQESPAAEQDALALLLSDVLPAGEQGLRPDQARFRLLDAVRLMLERVARETPLILILEDLHAADADTLNLLHHIARHVAYLPILIVGTYRDVEARASATAGPLWQTSRDATVLQLSRLTAKDIGEYLQARHGSAPAAEEVRALLDTTAGNPLFLTALVGMLQQDESDDRHAANLPDTVQQVICQQVDRLPEETSRSLSCAAVIGKSFTADALAAIADRDTRRVEQFLDPAIGARIIIRQDGGEFRFANGLYRDVLYHRQAKASLSRLHLRHVARLRERMAAGDSDHWSEIAAHLAAAGLEYRGEAVDAWRQAAGRARARLAFDDAAAMLKTAVGSFGEGPKFDPLDRCHLLLECAEAMLLAGDIDGGHAYCVNAFTIARTLQDIGLMTDAALMYGSAIVVAAVDQKLIGMLRECLDVLPENDAASRSCVLARLAAALQPAVNPTEPMAMARDAIALARTTHDNSVLYSVLRSAISALMDFAPAQERLDLNQESLALAAKSGDVPWQFRSNLRILVDASELGDRDTFIAALDACERIADRIDLPHYQWRAASARAMLATIEGRYAEAMALLDQAAQLAQRIDDLEAQVTIPIQRFAILSDWNSPRGSGLAEIQAQLDTAYANGMREAEFFIQPFISAFTLTAAADAKAIIANRAFVQRTFDGNDRFSVVAVADLALLADDMSLAERAFKALLPYQNECAATGLLGSSWCGPVAYELGRIAQALGRPDEAYEYFSTALGIAERMRAQPYRARILASLADAAAERGESELAKVHRATAQELFAEFEIRPVRKVPIESAPATRPARTAGTSFSIESQGDIWRVTLGGQSVLVKNSKGISMLSRLVAQPDTDIHVLDLSDSDPAATAGTTGPALDERARDAYRRRVRELEDVIEEAEQLGDTAGAESARGEIEFISQELSRAFGLGGRARPQGSAAERARVNVRRRIKDAIERIDAQLPGAGRYLKNTIKTGSYCRYSPM